MFHLFYVSSAYRFLPLARFRVQSLSVTSFISMEIDSPTLTNELFDRRRDAHPRAGDLSELFHPRRLGISPSRRSSRNRLETKTSESELREPHSRQTRSSTSTLTLENAVASTSGRPSSPTPRNRMRCLGREHSPSILYPPQSHTSPVRPAHTTSLERKMRAG